MRILLGVALAAVLSMGSLTVGHAHTTTFTAILTGVDESPPNASSGLGRVLVTLDMDLVTLDVTASFSSLLGTVTAAHLHAATQDPFTGTAIVALPFTGFPTGVTGGDYQRTFDLTSASSYDPGFIDAHRQGDPRFEVSDALNALDFAVDSGRAYVNIHTSAFPGGEIRGFLVASAAPEPSALCLLCLAAPGAIVAAGYRGARAKRRRPTRCQGSAAP